MHKDQERIFKAHMAVLVKEYILAKSKAKDIQEAINEGKASIMDLMDHAIDSITEEVNDGEKNRNKQSHFCKECMRFVKGRCWGCFESTEY